MIIYVIDGGYGPELGPTGAFPQRIVLLTVLLAWVVSRVLFIGTGKPVPPPGRPRLGATGRADGRPAGGRHRTVPHDDHLDYLHNGHWHAPHDEQPNAGPSRIQPPSSRVQGPDTYYSTALWLRAAFAGLHYDIHHAIADGDLVAVNSTMNGRHVGPWTVDDAVGAVDTVFPPAGRTFAMTQSHWFRIGGRSPQLCT